jgi:hypothetical protein
MSSEEISRIVRLTEERIRKCLRKGTIQKITYVEETMIIRIGYFDAFDVADLLEDQIPSSITYQVINISGMKSLLKVGGRVERKDNNEMQIG